MLVGLDVGGTYTDGVVIDSKGYLIAAAKFPTDSSDLLGSLSGCLDRVLHGLDPKGIRRIAISTTLLTNAILEDRLADTQLVVIPGTGVPTSLQLFGVAPYQLQGSIDFRGRELIQVDTEQVAILCKQLVAQGTRSVAICGKFSQRNNCQELAVAKAIAHFCPGVNIQLGHRHYTGLNFPRRANTTYLTAATQTLYSMFLEQVERSIREREILAPVVILKADGGTIPLEQAHRFPVETVYSGPAASILGAVALSAEQQTCGVVDIGGTTTDLGLILTGNPLYSVKGAEIGRFKTLVRSFAVSSVAVGGDSPVIEVDGKLQLGEQRRGQAVCLGGPALTPTDALRFLGLTEIGSYDLAAKALGDLAAGQQAEIRSVAEQIITVMLDKITSAFEHMLDSWKNEPAYRVWQVVEGKKLERLSLFGLGGAAQGIVPGLAARLNAECFVPEEGKVANAIGAALARTTFSCSLRADTSRRKYTIAETGTQKTWPYGLGTWEEAKNVLVQHFAEIAGELGLEDCSGVITRQEVFNVVQGGYTEGRIFELAMEREAGVLSRVSRRCGY